MRIIFLILLISSLAAKAQTYEVAMVAMDGANSDTLYIKSGTVTDSLFRLVGGNYVFAHKSKLKRHFSIAQVNGLQAALDGGGVAWGGITGTLSSQTDLNNALSGKAASSHSHAITDVTGYTGYTINVQALTSSPADGATIYFGLLPKAPVTTAGQSKVHIRKAGTIKIANIYCFSGTAGSNENWSVSIRINNTTDHLIQTVGASTSERIFTNSSLSIAVVAGDYIEIKCVNPTWATNPLTCIFGGYIYIE